MIHRTLLLLLPVLLLGCSTTSSTNEVNLEASPYYPLNVGTRWVYHGQQSQRVGGEWVNQEKTHKRTVKVTKHTLVKGKPCALVETYHDETLVNQDHVHPNKHGVFVIAAGNKILSVQVPLIRLPPIEGQHWSLKFRKGKDIEQGHYMLESPHTVDVPLGTYQAIPLRFETYAEGKRTKTYHYWFVKDVGIVKIMEINPTYRLVYELESFHPGS
jgi:hypothetical protein